MSALLLLAACVALGTYGVVSLAVSGPVLLVARRLARGAAADPAARARALLGLRVLPCGAGLLAAGIATLAFLTFEPTASVEPLSLPLVALAALGGVPVAAAARRWWSEREAARKLGARWRQSGETLRLSGFDLGVHVVDLAFPVAAVVGAFRPRLLLDRRLLGACERPELHAVLDHEVAHVRARDNLKRLALRLCPDALALTPVARRWEEAWSAAAEQAADAAAARRRPEGDLHLASALVKLARLATTTPAAPLPLPASTVLGSGPIEDRVRRLLEPGTGAAAPKRSSTAALTAAALLGAAALGLLELRAVYDVVERVVTLLT